MPTGEFCASLTDNSTTFGILELGTLHGNQYPNVRDRDRAQVTA